MGNRAKGYSLIELLASTTIVMVLSAMSFPMANSSLDRYRLYGDADRLANQLQNVRFLAISTNYSHRLHINDDSVEVQRLEGGVFMTVESFQLRPGVEFAATWASDPVFSPRGTVSPSGAITLETRHGLQRIISISVLGRVSEQ
ncbi:MAG: prepilin-type N-terminal cleavage/methylation domain-containing protein [Acidobacteria bacterium]|nr:prepilin-type N-terminal cleavage/methylation domain-containing protein [Acidobacteriota bacterium]